MRITGTGLPLVTPFDDDGDVDHEALADLVSWVETRGIDFIVPAGSNSEAPMLRTDEHAAVVETVCESASIPVMAGTGTPGYGPTLDLTGRAADAGAEGALVVTPFYYDHDQDALEIYYRDLADEAPIPIYLYSVPAYTHKPIDPELVGRLAEHPNIQGMKDSSGNIDRFYRTLDRAFPGAKFIHVVRDRDAWIASAVKDFGTYPNAIHQAIYGSPCPVGHEDAWLARYDRHNAEVAAYFADRPDDLLSLRLEDGISFEAVCPFLGQPMVARGTPVANTRAKKRLKMAWWKLTRRFGAGR